MCVWIAFESQLKANFAVVVVVVAVVENVRSLLIDRSLGLTTAFDGCMCRSKCISALKEHSQ